MQIKCPHCNNRFRFLDLYLFRLKGYKIKCSNCGSIFQLDARIDQFGILLIALLAMGLILLFGVLFKVISNFVSFSSTAEIVIITFMIVLVSTFIIYGHPAYLVWHIKRKYQKEKEQKI